MNFRVLLIKDSEIKKEAISKKGIKSDFVKEYSFIYPFHCFKILNDISTVEKGIEKIDNEIVDSAEFLTTNDGRRIVSMGFIFVNSSNGNIYVNNYADKKLEKFLEKYFHIKGADTKVDADKLKKISEIELKLTASNQLNFFHECIPLENINLVDELKMQDEPIEKLNIKYYFKNRGAFFNRDGLKKIISKYDNITISGYDENENILKIKDVVQLIVNININPNSFSELEKITFEDIIELLLEKEENSLNGY